MNYGCLLPIPVIFTISATKSQLGSDYGCGAYEQSVLGQSDDVTKFTNSSYNQPGACKVQTACAGAALANHLQAHFPHGFSAGATVTGLQKNETNTTESTTTTETVTTTKKKKSNAVLLGLGMGGVVALMVVLAAIVMMLKKSGSGGNAGTNSEQLGLA